MKQFPALFRLFFFLALLALAASPSVAVPVDADGSWSFHFLDQEQFNDFDFGFTSYSVDPSGPLAELVQVFPVTVNPGTYGGSYSIGADSAEWRALGDLILLEEPDDGEESPFYGEYFLLNLSASQNKMARVDFERYRTSPGNPTSDSVEDFGWAIGVKTDALTVGEVVGTWDLYDVLITDTYNSGSGFYDFVSYDLEHAEFIFVQTSGSGGTFTFQQLDSSCCPEDIGDSGGGTWSISGGDLVVQVGPGEFETVANASVEGDFFVLSGAEGVDGNGQREYGLTIGMKRAVSLSPADIEGTWILNETSAVLAGGGSSFVNYTFEREEVVFNNGGTGFIRTLENEEFSAPRSLQAFTWQIVNGNQVEITDDEDSETFHVSAGRDVIVLQDSFEEGGGMVEREFGIALKAPGLNDGGLAARVAAAGPNEMGLSAGQQSQPGAGGAILLRVPEAPVGDCYRLESSLDLRFWHPVEPEVLLQGAGGPLVWQEDVDSIAGFDRWFRLRLVPCP